MLMEPIGTGERPITVFGNDPLCEDIEGCEIVWLPEGGNPEGTELCVCGGMAWIFDPWIYYDED